MIDLHKEALLSDDNVVLQAILSGPSAKQPSDRCLLFLDELFWNYLVIACIWFDRFEGYALAERTQ